MLVSLIIPAHNASRTLERTLISASGQTMRELEIIVVDDASIDGTGDIARAHASRDSRLRLVRNDTVRGVGGARNRGAAEASGAYFSFLDSDDLLAPGAIEARMQAMRAAHADFCYAWSAMIDENDRIVRIIDNRIEGPSFFEDLVVRGNFLGNGSCALMTRQAFAAAGGYSEELFRAGAQGYEDYQFYLDVAKRCKAVCCSEVLIGYRIAPDNMSSDTRRMLRSLDLVQGKILGEYPQFGSALRASRDKYLLYCAVMELRGGRMVEALHLAGGLGMRLPLMGGHLWQMVRSQSRRMGTGATGACFEYGRAPEAVG